MTKVKTKRKKTKKPTITKSVDFVCLGWINFHRRDRKPKTFKGYLYTNGDLELSAIQQHFKNHNFP